MAQVLDAYPKVKGLQIMSDEGVYMFSRYSGKWIPDTKARRKAILDRLRSWTAFSTSSPVAGIEIAILTFLRADRKTSLYFFGDEFTGGSNARSLQPCARYASRRDERGTLRPARRPYTGRGRRLLAPSPTP